MILNRLQIRLLIHQTLQFTGISNLNLGNPSITLRALIDSLGLVTQHSISVNHLSGDGRQNIRGRLYRFDGADGFAGCDLEIGGREFDVYDVTEGFGGVVGDADCCWKFKLLDSEGKDISFLPEWKRRQIEGIVQWDSACRRTGSMLDLPMLPSSSTHSWDSVYFLTSTIINN